MKHPVTDGHNALWTGDLLIGCQCGWAPAKRPERMSMQHVPHQAHRRKLKLQPIEYAWSDDAYGMPGALSGGGLMQVRNARWENGKWVRT